jgi:hypothetical protein
MRRLALREVFKAQIGSRTVRLYQVSERVSPAGTAFSLCHAVKTFHGRDRAEHLMWNRSRADPDCLGYAAIAAKSVFSARFNPGPTS